MSRHNLHPCEWEGQVYACIQDLADACFDGNYDKAKYRVKRGYKREADLPNNRPVVVNNKLYANSGAAADALGITTHKVRQMIDSQKRSHKHVPKADAYANSYISQKFYKLRKRLQEVMGNDKTDMVE